MKQTVCDRCHGQRLKCEFTNGGTGDSCKRCTRARAKCTYPTYGERVPNQIEDQGRPNAAQNQMTNPRGTNPSESLPTHPRLNSHRHGSFTTLASPRLDRGPSQAHMSRKRLRSSMEGLASSYPYPMTTASEQSLDAAISQEAFDHVATAPAHDVLNVPFDFTWSDVEILQLDGLASDSLLGPYPDGSPRYMPHLHDTSDGPVSPSSSSTPSRLTVETYKDVHCAAMPAPSVSLSPASANTEATLEDQLCRLWRDLGCSAVDRTNLSVSEAHQHTTTLINITKAFVTHPETFSPATDTLAADTLAADDDDAAQQQHATNPPNDPSIILFILSCHTRLLRFYKRLLSLLLLEISSSTSPPSSENDTPKTNATTASALSWVQSVSSIAHLAEKLGDAMRLLRGPSSCGESGGADVGEKGEFDEVVRTQGEVLERLRKGVCARVEVVRARIRESDAV